MLILAECSALLRQAGNHDCVCAKCAGDGTVTREVQNAEGQTINIAYPCSVLDAAGNPSAADEHLNEVGTQADTAHPDTPHDIIDEKPHMVHNRVDPAGSTPESRRP